MLFSSLASCDVDTQLVGIVSLMIAAKYLEIYPPEVFIWLVDRNNMLV